MCHFGQLAIAEHPKIATDIMSTQMIPSFSNDRGIFNEEEAMMDSA